MSEITILRKNIVLRGLLVGLLSLVLLEVGTLAVMAGFNMIGIWYLKHVPYYSLLVFNAIIASLLGFSIIKKLKILKFMVILNILVAIIIFLSYWYFVWYRFSHGI